MTNETGAQESDHGGVNDTRDEKNQIAEGAG
jgi:hypothetical protein